MLMLLVPDKYTDARRLKFSKEKLAGMIVESRKSARVSKAVRIA